jgi:hypothetical protein
MIGQYLSNNNEKSYSAVLKKKFACKRSLGHSTTTMSTSRPRGSMQHVCRFTWSSMWASSTASPVFNCYTVELNGCRRNACGMVRYSRVHCRSGCVIAGGYEASPHLSNLQWGIWFVRDANTALFLRDKPSHTFYPINKIL